MPDTASITSKALRTYCVQMRDDFLLWLLSSANWIGCDFELCVVMTIYKLNKLNDGRRERDEKYKEKYHNFRDVRLASLTASSSVRKNRTEQNANFSNIDDEAVKSFSSSFLLLRLRIFNDSCFDRIFHVSHAPSTFHHQSQDVSLKWIRERCHWKHFAHWNIEILHFFL